MTTANLNAIVTDPTAINDLSKKELVAIHAAIVETMETDAAYAYQRDA